MAKKKLTTLFGARKKAWREPRRIHGATNHRIGFAKRGSYTRAKKR